MQAGPNPSKWFYRSSKTNEVEGPFDLVELAGFLASGDITGETLTRTEYADDWHPFQERLEFATAKDIPLEVIMRHLDEEEEEQDEKSPLTPKHIYYFFWFLGGFVVYVGSLLIFPHRHRHDSNEWLIMLMRLIGYHMNNGGS